MTATIWTAAAADGDDERRENYFKAWHNNDCTSQSSGFQKNLLVIIVSEQLADNWHPDCAITFPT